MGGGEPAADPEPVMYDPFPLGIDDSIASMERVLLDGYVVGNELLPIMAAANVPGGGSRRSSVEDLDGRQHPADFGDGYLRVAGFAIPFAVEDQAVAGSAPPATVSDHFSHPKAERHDLAAGTGATKNVYANDTFNARKSQVANEAGAMPRFAAAKLVGSEQVFFARGAAAAPRDRMVYSTANADITSETTTEPASVEDAYVGTRVQVVGYTCPGTLRFVGMHASKGTPRYGVELDRPIGKNDGAVSRHRYFRCAEKCGVLVTPDKVKVIFAEGQDGGGGDPGWHNPEYESILPSQPHVNGGPQRAAPNGVRKVFEPVEFEEALEKKEKKAAPGAIRIDISGPYDEVVTIGQQHSQAAANVAGVARAGSSSAEATIVQDHQQRDLSALRNMVLSAKENPAASSGKATAALHPAVLATAIGLKPRKGYENVEATLGPAAPRATRIDRDVGRLYDEVVTMTMGASADDSRV